jgi:hypothetical protein
MGVINNEGLAKLKGCLDECFKVPGVAVIITVIRGGVFMCGTATNVV